MVYIKTENGIEKMTKEERDQYIEKNKTDEQKNRERVSELKGNLKNTDYQSIKAFEGCPSDNWEEIKDQRESWREEIRIIEGE